MPITVGDTVPPVQAPTYLRGRHNARLMGPVDHLGRWVVLVFYPRDFTFVCPTELAELADLTPAFMARAPLEATAAARSARPS